MTTVKSVNTLNIFSFLITIVLLNLFVTDSCKAQSNFYMHYPLGNLFQTSNSILQNDDGSYIMAGGADTAASNPNGMRSGLLKKIDSNGNVLWTSYYNFPTVYNVSFNKIKKTVDGNYIVVGEIDYGFSVSATFVDVLISKIDTLGNILWLKSYGDVGADAGYDVEELANGDFLIQAAYGVSVNLNVFNSFQLIRTNSVGDSLWTHHYYTYDGLEQFTSDVAQTSDMGFISVGMRLTLNAETTGFLVKTDSLGNEKWHLPLDSSVYNDLISVSPGNGNFTVFGNTNIGTAEEPFIANIDHFGNINWTKTINEINVHISRVTKTFDHDYVLTGVEVNGNNTIVVLIKVDSLGNKLWKKSFNQFNFDFPNDIHQTVDSGYIVTGSTYDAVNLIYSLFALKTIDSLMVTSVPTHSFSSSITAYPNPVQQELVLNLNEAELEKIHHFCFYNLYGKEVSGTTNYLKEGNRINVSILKPGVYFLKLTFKNEQPTQVIKIIKL